MEDLVIYSLPVSGGCFVAQLALLCELYDAKKKYRGGKFKSEKEYAPTICFGASGGNVCAYIAYAGNWSSDGIMRMARTIKSRMFICNWFPDYMSFLPTGILGIFNGSLYRPGYGALYTFNRAFREKTIQSTEIWTGTYNTTTNRAEFFCNRSREDAYIQQSFFEADLGLYDVMPLRYLADEPQTIEMIAKASMASASIPYIVKNQKIGEHTYADGGVMYSSPTLPLCNEIYRLVKGHEYKKEFRMKPNGSVVEKQDLTKPKRLRHFYFSPYDMYSKEIVFHSRTGGNGPIAQILHANLIQDKASAISNLQRIYGIESSQIIHEHYSNVEADTLVKILHKLEHIEHFVCDLYPKGLVKIPLQCFTTEQIEEKVAFVRSSYAIQIWYYTN